MNQKKKHPTCKSGFSKIVQDANQEQNDDTTKPIVPSKKPEVIEKAQQLHSKLLRQRGMSQEAT